MDVLASSVPVDSDKEDSGNLTEHTSLLVRRESATAYASDGETPIHQTTINTPSGRRSVSPDSDGEPEVGYAGRGGVGEDDSRGRRRPQGRTAAEDEENQQDDEDKDSSCGLVYCGRKLLKLLPEIGDGEEDDSEGFEEALKYGAQQIIQLIIPVTICMAIVIIFELTVAVNEEQTATEFYLIPEDKAGGSSGLLFLIAVTNAVIFIVLIIIMTVVLVLLFKYRCYKAIFVWLVVASALLLFVISGAYFVDILLVHNLVIDWFSFLFFIWNFGSMGLMSIHWKGPLKLQQAYLILTSALVATTFLKYLPNWTTWVLLIAISLYDLFAVLCPKGPLRVLVETAKERNQPIFPSLIYSSTMVWIVGMADTDVKKKNGAMPKERPHKNGASKDEEAASDSSSNTDTDDDVDRRAAATEMVRSQQNPDQRQQTEEGDNETSRPKEEEDEPRGFKLGLGDFIFYSILVGKAAHDSEGDWVIISSCFVAILIGLCITSLILGVVRRALPALPISIFFGLIFYFSSQYIIAPFGATLATSQVFI